MGDAIQNKNMKASFFQPKKRLRVLSEPDYLQSAQSTSGNNELPNQTDDVEFASTAPTPIRILTRAATEDNGGAVTKNNGGANGINVTGSATKDKINEPLNIGRTDNTPNNQTNYKSKFSHSMLNLGLCSGSRFIPFQS